MSEKVGGAEGTKLDEDFKELERVTYIHTQVSFTYVNTPNGVQLSIYAQVSIIVSL